jgi:hypothetical protein
LHFSKCHETPFLESGYKLLKFRLRHGPNVLVASEQHRGDDSWCRDLTNASGRLCRRRVSRYNSHSAMVSGAGQTIPIPRDEAVGHRSEPTERRLVEQPSNAPPRLSRRSKCGRDGERTPTPATVINPPRLRGDVVMAETQFG